MKTLSIHTDLYIMFFENTGKLIASKLAALVSIEYLWCSKMRDGFFKG